MNIDDFSRIEKGAVLLGLFIVLFAGYFLASGGVIEDVSESGETHEVLDCFPNKEECEMVSLNRTYSECRHVYDVSKDMEGDPPCNMTSSGVKDVSMIADPMNHVRAPFTDISYSKEYFNPGLEQPWDLEFLPDGSALITQENGTVFQWDRGQSLEPLGTIDVIHPGTTGMMGVAIHPDFEDNHYVYLYYTTGWDEEANSKSSFSEKVYVTQEIARFRLVNGTLQDKEVLLDEIPGGLYLAGGRLEFGPDGKLYATTGASSPAPTAQDPTTLDGKILRMNPDGSLPEDNPDDTYSYARGIKNSQGLAWHPETGTMYATEHGPWRHDELNRIKPGHSYGWGALACSDVWRENMPVSEPYLGPVHCIRNWTLAPSGATFVDDPKSPLYGDLLVAGLRGKQVHRFDFRGDDLVGNEIFFVREEKKYREKKLCCGSVANTKVGTSRRIRDVEYFNESIWVLGDIYGIARLYDVKEDRY